MSTAAPPRDWSYCSRCVLPDTRPGLSLDRDGVCTACNSHAARPTIDWDERERAFGRVVDEARRRSAGYDCLIPVSGGKDSTWQVVTCLDHGLRPLCVTWRPPRRTPIGQRNLDNLVSLGVDHIEFRINPEVEARFARAAFRSHGDPAIPMHMALFAIPLDLAARYRIPLVVWGENSAVEYGGDDGVSMGHRLDGEWLARYGVTAGTTWRDWQGCEGLIEGDLLAYRGPSPDELAAAGCEAVFLGHYFAWDPAHTAAVARRHGFRSDDAGPRTGSNADADIDDELISVHH
ncbi:MAG: N-acetyl sugar amidotransferase, partial [Miltoncostaeaceae bacterium]